MTAATNSSALIGMHAWAVATEECPNHFCTARISRMPWTSARPPGWGIAGHLSRQRQLRSRRQNPHHLTTTHTQWCPPTDPVGGHHFCVLKPPGPIHKLKANGMGTRMGTKGAAMERISRISIRLWLGGAGDGNRTRVSSLGSWRSTIELRPHARRPATRLRV